MNATSSHEIQEECFHVIIAMMGYAESCGSERLGLFAKPSITQLAGGHLYAHVMTLRIAARAEMANADGDIILTAQTATEGLITIAFYATQLEITMKRMNAITQLMKG